MAEANSTTKSICDRNILDGYGTVDVFCEALGRIEQIGPCRRLTFVTRNAMTPENYDVVSRVVLSVEALQDLILMAAADRPMPVQLSTLRTDQRAN